MKSKSRTTEDPVLAKLRAICMSLADTVETQSWGHPNFCVGRKIYTGYETYKGHWYMFFLVGREHQPLFLKDRRFISTPYIGKHGWISLRIEGRLNWGEIRHLVQDSYELVKAQSSRKS